MNLAQRMKSRLDSMRLRHLYKGVIVTSSFLVVYLMFVYVKYNSPDTVNVHVLVPRDWKDINCVKTKTLPPYTACLLPLNESKVSVNITKNGVWEEYLIKMLKRSFDFYPRATLIDVGANIGFFTMLAATMGHDVIAVEPMRNTIKRIQKSVARDKLGNKVTIVNNAISGRRTYFSMGGDDPRADYMQVLKEVSMEKSRAKKDVAPAIYMDDLLNFVKTNVALLKIDIEGYECQAMKKMSLLLENVFVPYIFMEWLWIYRNQNKPNTWCTSSELRSLASQLLSAGYIPFDIKRKSTGRLDPNKVTTWDVKDMGWRHKSAPHLLF